MAGKTCRNILYFFFKNFFFQKVTTDADGATANAANVAANGQSQRYTAEQNATLIVMVFISCLAHQLNLCVKDDTLTETVRGDGSMKAPIDVVPLVESIKRVRRLMSLLSKIL